MHECIDYWRHELHWACIVKRITETGYKVILFPRSSGNNFEKCTHVQGNCGNALDLLSAFKKARPDVIIYMAAYFQSH